MKKKAILNFIWELPNFFSLFMYSFIVVAISSILLERSKELSIKPESFNLITTFFFAGIIVGQVIYFGLIMILILVRWSVDKKYECSLQN